MEAFVWNEHFTTGIESVDTQHHHLVDIVNRLGDLLIAAQPVDKETIEDIFRQLAEYANTHFRDEEHLMRTAGVSEAHYQHHCKVHRDFVAQVKSMWQARGLMSAPADTLHGFLAAWLSYHILGEDQEMAEEIRRLKGGPALAHAPGADGRDRSTGALLHALRNLHGVLSHMNQDLMRANASLEEEVATRTRELLQSEKMASIGQLAAGVAHEINNPIGFVNSNLGTLGRYVDDLLRLADLGAATPDGQALGQELDLDFLRADLRDLLRESQDGLDRVRKIVANLKDFSRVDQAEWQVADLLAGLESTLNVAWHELKYKADIVRELRPLPLVRCVPAQINQVFLNLLVNAAQAIKEHGTITLRSGVEGDTVWIEVADNGCGMDETTQRRMFEPFFTTKPVGTGTGLGMSLTWDIVTKHDGEIAVDSAPGRGTRIRVTLPVGGPSGG
ncbi:MAG: bacteriohemerythrin [Pseudomonadota bacterium]